MAYLSNQEGIFPYLTIYLSLKILIWMFEEYLRYRQKKKKEETSVPKELREKISEKTFQKSQDYSLDNLHFGAIKGAIELAFDSFFLVSGIFPYVWKKTDSVVELCHLNPQNDIVKAIVFSILFTIYNTIMEAPFDAYRAFVIDEQYGFNNQTIGLFIKDRFIGLGVSVVLISIILSGLLALINWGGIYFWVYAWIFVCIVQFIIMLIYPNVIAPLFNKFTELEEGELRQKIEELCKKVEFPLKKIYIMDQSKRSTHSNAYFYGFGSNRRIVLFDTLKTFPNNQIISVLCHELGHWTYMHPLKIFCINIAHMLMLFFLFGLFKNNAELYQSFGFVDTSSNFIGLSLFIMFYFPVETILTFLIVQLMRCFEANADKYASQAGYGEELKSALLKLFVHNKGDMNPDIMYSTYHYTHPTLIERLKLLSDLESDKKSK